MFLGVSDVKWLKAIFETSVSSEERERGDVLQLSLTV